MKKIGLLICMCIANLSATDENIDSLLASYKSESDLSKITKSESAGFVDVYTREDMERMQARTLSDIVRLFTIPMVSRSRVNATLFVKPSMKQMPTSAVRIFVNDHDISASAYKSGSLICDSITLDVIDHIEVYRSSASVEFGNEPATVMIKLYTKTAAREEGGKVRITADNQGSSSLSIYQGKSVSNDFDYFAYANVNAINRKEYYNQGYALKSDSENANMYGSFNYKNWRAEFGHFQSKSDPFLGFGKDATPDGGNMDTSYSYIHVTNKLSNGVRLQASVDYIEYTGDFRDSGGIAVGDYGLVQTWQEKTTDSVYSFIVDKRLEFSDSALYLGGFIKRKSVDVADTYNSNNITSYTVSYNLFSLYAEEKYNFSHSLMGVVSAKADIYRYDEATISDTENYIVRLGLIKNIDNIQLKAFYTNTYYQIPLMALYSNGTNAPYKTNGDLKSSQPTLYSLGIRYKNKHHQFHVRGSYIELKNPIVYKADLGYINGNSSTYSQYEASYTYLYDLNNKLTFDVYYGKRGDSMEYSAPYGGHIILYNKYKKLDFFNLLDMRAAYSDYGVDVGNTYNWTSSIRYHYSQDLLFGLKGENILNKGYEQVYQGLDYAIPTLDRKIWLNMEYLF